MKKVRFSSAGRRAADGNGQVVAWQARPLLDVCHKARRGALADGVAVGEGRAAGLLLLLHLLFFENRGEGIAERARTRLCCVLVCVCCVPRDPCTFQIWNALTKDS